LLNLLGNAVKYTVRGGIELRILGGCKPDSLHIEVADTGPGIDDGDRDSLFQDFERLSAAASIQGAGLGLAIAARIVGLMNGEMGHTANPGGGSIFWLELPVGDLTTMPAAPSDALPTDQPAGEKRVLLVDDIAMNRDVIGTFLRAAGHSVVLADSGREAIRLAGEATFDLILMDMRMPEMDGLEATRLIRALPVPHGKVPVIALTACAFADHVAQCKAAGMNGHIAKPVDYKTLIKVVGETTVRAAEADKSGLRFDRSMLNQTLGVMTAEEGSRHLLALRERLIDILRLFGEPNPPADLASAGHALISAAGMFGFASLSAVSRSFEDAVFHASPQTEPIAKQLAEETRAALETLDDFMADTGRQAA
jgi:CheY-like chemotaxis protein